MRPESVRVRAGAAGATGGDGSSGGTIVSSMFYGESIEYDVRTDAGTLVVAVADPHEEQIFAPGDVVEVEFEEERAWLLPGTARTD